MIYGNLGFEDETLNDGQIKFPITTALHQAEMGRWSKNIDDELLRRSHDPQSNEGPIG